MSNLLATSSPAPAGIIVALCALVTVGLLIGSRKSGSQTAWPTGRVLLPHDAAPVWIGLGVMVLVYVYVPWIARFMVGDSSTATATTGPTTLPTEPAIRLLPILATYAGGLLAAIALHAYLRTPVKRLFGLVTPNRTDLRALLVAGLVAIPLTYLTSAATQQLWQRLDWPHPTSHPMLELMTHLRDRPMARVAALSSAIVLAPLFEEVLFRAHLQTGLFALLRNRWAAIVITSSIFATLHPWWTIPPIFVLSVMIGLLYERTNNLWLAIGLHIGFNGISTGVFLLAR